MDKNALKFRDDGKKRKRFAMTQVNPATAASARKCGRVYNCYNLLLTMSPQMTLGLLEDIGNLSNQDQFSGQG